MGSEVLRKNGDYKKNFILELANLGDLFDYEVTESKAEIYFNALSLSDIIYTNLEKGYDGIKLSDALTNTVINILSNNNLGVIQFNRLSILSLVVLPNNIRLFVFLLSKQQLYKFINSS